MISLKRIRTISAINEKYRGNGKRANDMELLKARRTYLNNTAKPLSFNTKYWKNAKNQLKQESYGKCVYCEADTDVVAHGDVEHYRPKSIYWWLAYTYDNYLYCCQICNQIYKSDNFPILGSLYPSPVITAALTDAELELLSKNVSPDPLELSDQLQLDTFLALHRAEKALLLNPYFDNPATYIAYTHDDTLREVSIVARNESAEPYVQAMIDYYGINRIELKNLRYRVFTKFRIFKRAYAAVNDQVLKTDIGKQIKEMLADYHTFSGMNRYYDSIL